MSVYADRVNLGQVTTEGWPASQPLLHHYYHRGIMTTEEYNTAVADIMEGRLQSTADYDKPTPNSRVAYNRLSEPIENLSNTKEVP